MKIKNLKKQLCLFCLILMLGNGITAFANDTDMIVTNEELIKYTTVKYTASATYSIAIPKEIILNDNKPTSYDIKVSGNITSDMQINVEPVDAIEEEDGINFYMVETTSKKQVVATVTQDSTSCLYNKVNDANGTTLSGNIGAISLEAGEWEGSLGFKLSVSTHEHDYNDERICNDCGDVKVEKEIIANITNGEATYDGNATNGNAKVEVVSPSNGYTITYGTTNGTYDLDEIPTYTNLGTYEVYYKIEAPNYITKTGNFTITINEGLNGYTWSEVQAICNEGNANKYFSVGDMAMINLGEMDTMQAYSRDGKTSILDEQLATIIVGDISSDGKTLTMLFTSYSTQAPAYQMNPQTDDNEYGTNVGGWKATILRDWLNSEDEGGFYNALSSDLQNAIIDHSSSYSKTYNASDVSYCDDKIWLLSAKEVWGGETATTASRYNTTYWENLAAFNAESQLTYFANGGSRVRYSSGDNNEDPDNWWLRSSSYDDSYSFTGIYYEDCQNSYEGNYTCYVFPAFCIGEESEKTFNNYSWSEIYNICKQGKASEYFNVGDTKTINIDALPSAENNTEMQKATIVIADIADDGTSMTLLVTNYSISSPTHVMNETESTSGGWASTSMRTWLNGEYYNALPSGLQEIILENNSSYSESFISTSVSYCEDKVWLLSTREVFGGEDATTNDGTSTHYENLYAFNDETQLAYFAIGNDDRIRYTNSDKTSTNTWWLRSTNWGDSDIAFMCVDDSGNSSYPISNNAYAVFPAFNVGYEEEEVTCNIEKKDTFSDYTWAEVQEVCQLGLANKYFADCIGQKVTISLGKMDTLTYANYREKCTLSSVSSLASQTATVSVADVSNNSVTMIITSYSTQAPFYLMNPQTSDSTYGTNAGGWASTSMRSWLNTSSSGGFYAALPSDLKSVIKTHKTLYVGAYGASKVSSCNDKIWLLSAKEILGSNASGVEDVVLNAETQLAYFANGNSMVRYLQGTDDTAIVYWLRDGWYFSNKTDAFCIAGDLEGSTGFFSSPNALGVFPAFDIG
jgi:hypothetical protein